MDDLTYAQKKAQLRADAEKARDGSTNPAAAYFASWLLFYMDEAKRWHTEYESVLAAARYVANG